MKSFIAVFIGTAEARERSGWDKLDDAKREVQQLLDRLPDGTAMNLLFFSNDVYS